MDYAEKLASLYENEGTVLIPHNNKGNLMFQERFLSNITFSTEHDVKIFCINAAVKAEMRKSCVYNAKTKITFDCEVLPCCGCPARCKHVFALLYAIEDYSRK